jgi:hypothetical protein
MINHSRLTLPQGKMAVLALTGAALLMLPATAQAQYDGMLVGTVNNSTTLYGPPVPVKRTITEESVATRQTPFGETTTHSFRTYDATPRHTAPAVRTYSYNYLDPTKVEPAAGMPRAIGTSDIAAVQQILRSRGYYTGPIDGALGGDTTQALRFYQAHNNLTASGAINDETLYSLGLIDRLTVPVGDFYTP